MPKTAKTTKRTSGTYPLSSPNERAEAWKKAKGIWKNRKPEPIEELESTRSSLDKKFPFKG
jgi:hypothetical protein